MIGRRAEGLGSARNCKEESHGFQGWPSKEDDECASPFRVNLGQDKGPIRIRRLLEGYRCDVSSLFIRAKAGFKSMSKW